MDAKIKFMEKLKKRVGASFKRNHQHMRRELNRLSEQEQLLLFVLDCVERAGDQETLMQIQRWKENR